MLPDIKVFGNEVSLTVSGSIYVREATLIREKLMQFCSEGYNQFIIHVDDLEYIDSSGLGVLVAIQKRAVKQNGKVTIKGLTGKIRDLFELTRLTKVFEIQE